MDEILPPAPVRSEIDDRDFDGGGHRGGADPGMVQFPPARSATGEIVKEVLEESAQEAGEISAGDAGFTHAMGRNEGVEHIGCKRCGLVKEIILDGKCGDCLLRLQQEIEELYGTEPATEPSPNQIVSIPEPAAAFPEPVPEFTPTVPEPLTELAFSVPEPVPEPANTLTEPVKAVPELAQPVPELFTAVPEPATEPSPNQIVSNADTDGEEQEIDLDAAANGRLWNIETYGDKNGKRRIRQTLRFIAPPRRYELGIVTPEHEEILKSRPGRAAWKQGREDAKLLRVYAEQAAESYDRDKAERLARKNGSKSGRRGVKADGNEVLPATQPDIRDGVSSVQSDEWAKQIDGYVN